MQPTPTTSLEKRLSFFQFNLGTDNPQQQAFQKIYTDNAGNWEAVAKELNPKMGFDAVTVKNLSFTHDVAEWTNDNSVLIKTFQEDVNINSLHDIAKNYDRKEFAALVNDKKAFNDGETASTVADDLYNELFQMEPTTIIKRVMSKTGNIIFDGKDISTAVNTFLQNLAGDFNIKTTSVYKAFENKKAFNDIPNDHQEDVKKYMKALQRITAISSVEDAVPLLVKNNFTSAYLITQLPKQQFRDTMKGSFEENDVNTTVLDDMYVKAEDLVIRNEQALAAIRELKDFRGNLMIGGNNHTSKEKNIELDNAIRGHNLSWDLLFGNADYCECGECTSVYSAAAYYVELLQYLRNNNLDKYEKGDLSIRKDTKEVSGTPLEKLLSRRPDLGSLELTCANTNTILPYVDLVNEVMEKYVINLTSLPIKLPDNDSLLKIKSFPSFNVSENQNNAELLASPQYTEQNAYKILSETLALFHLPYHQPIDAIRVYLDFLNSGRYELIKTFINPRDKINALQPGKEGGLKSTITNDLITYNQSEYQNSVLDDLYKQYQQRAADAEYLCLNPAEYAIITNESFVSKEYWDTQHFQDFEDGSNDIHSHGIHTDVEYRDKIGLPPVRKYYGYNDDNEMLSKDETEKKGLYFVKEQLLARSGITYAELEAIMKTNFINPNVSQSGIRIVGDEIDLTGTCDPDSLRLSFGLPFNAINRYDKFHRFISLQRKLGWTIDEVDKSISTDITPHYLHDLVAIKKIQEKTGLELVKLLCCWNEISTAGENSLYNRLFLTHNLLAMDDVFLQSANGRYLDNAGTIAEHLSAVMAALNLSAADIEAIKNYRSLPDPQLNISNLSLLYRYRLLSKTFGLRIPEFIKLVEVFGDVFENAHTTLVFLEQLQKLEEAGFTHDQLSYIIVGKDDLTSSLMPSRKEVIVLAKKIFDGINEIELAHADLQTEVPGTTAEEKATTALVRNKALLLFEPETVESIISLLEIDNLFTASVPAGLDFTEPSGPHFTSKYFKESGLFQITGVLSGLDIINLKNLKDNQSPPKPLGDLWNNAIDNIVAKQTAIKTKQQANIEVYDRELAAFLNNSISRDVIVGISFLFTSASQKRLIFLDAFLPYLKDQLRRKLIFTSLAEQTGLSTELTEVLVADILKEGTQSLYDSLLSVTAPGISIPSSWYGKIIPQADDDYTFVINSGSDRKFNISLDNILLIDHQPEPLPVRVIELQGTAQKLQAGKVYQLSLEGISLDELSWKTITASKDKIPLKVLLPDFKMKHTRFALAQLAKTNILVNVLSLSAEEIVYFNKRSDFDDINFNKIKLNQLLRLVDYCTLRNSLPKAKINMLEFWKLLSNTPIDLSQHISDLTHWNKNNINKLISQGHFNLTVNDFKNEQTLLRLQNALAVADKIGVDIDLLFEWTLPGADFKALKAIADNIQKAIRSRYNQTDWEQVVKPLNDQLRNNQKIALIAYLLQQENIKTAGIEDADGLFEFFLVDVQMDTCMETSRIKQAISSVQLFIQRCFIGLENGISPDLLDRERWKWMQRYRVWEANRKVFLYPENWIESNLREDKSPFFKELESELLQKDINKQNVEDTLKNYLYKVDEVANMEVIGLYIEGNKKDNKWNQDSKLHVFSRTRNAPYFFYYRYLALDEMNWYPWEKMQVDIPSYDVEDEYGQITSNGCYLTPVVWNGRLLIFFPQFTKKTKPVNNSNQIPKADARSGIVTIPKPIESWEIKMAWSEYTNGKWTQKKLSNDAIYDEIAFTNPISSGANQVSILKANMEETKRIYEQNKTNAALIRAEYAKNKREKVQALQQKKGPPALKGGALDKINEKISTLTEKIEEAEVRFIKPERTSHSNYLKALDDYIRANTTATSNIKTISYFSGYQFIPGLAEKSSLLIIGVYNYSSPKGIFEFSGGKIQSLKKLPPNETIVTNYFHYFNSTILSLQKTGNTGYFPFQETLEGTKFVNRINFFNPFTNEMIKEININTASFFSILNKNITDNKNDAFEAFGGLSNHYYHELKRPYSLYNWELFFHTPMLLADALSKSQQFEEAMNWFHYVFNPMAKGEKDNRFWQFFPFTEINSLNILEQIFTRLTANTYDDAVSAWRNNPFMPHIIARDRPVAYMKWVVMKYVDNIIAWGDYLFRQDTIESINQATQLYVLAGHILGNRPQVATTQIKKTSQSYLSLLSKWDASSNAMSELETALVHHSSTLSSVAVTTREVVPTSNIYGSLSSLYFCVPSNPKLLGYWDTVADRLFKIRHCENIEGVFRKLPLFEPPIDPALLVKAAAQGLSIAGVLNDLNSSMPNYRFYYLLQKALELCGELKSMGTAILSAIEKKDNEAIALIRAKHESSMQNLMIEIKKQQLEEAGMALENLQQNRKSPEHRMKYYLQLIGEDTGKVPGSDSGFNEIANSIELPINESGLKLIKYEKEEMDKSHEARVLQDEIGRKELLASILHLYPSIRAATEPLGLGASVEFGGPMLGGAMQAWAKHLQNNANGISYEATNAGKKAGFLRSMQDRVMQANAAGYEIKQIDKQILSQQIRIEIANQEITNQQKQIDNAQEIEEFLKNKYSNEELYSWMKDSLSSLYHQVYSLAFDLAKKAEKTYCFERGLTSSNFINAGYWDAGRNGLLAGEQLYVGLKQLEAAYQENRGYDYEITKHISLRQLNPLAILQLKQTGKTEFSLPEVLFDMDYPGHYKRRIKSVSISIPCIAGPYTGLNATLRLLENKFRNSAIANNATEYSEKTDGSENGFHGFIIPINAIAVSSGQNDSGMFELNFKDERYLPFEGAGVISKWQLELPSFRQFNYDTISDVIIHVRYTSVEGGDRLKNVAELSVTAFNSTLNGIIKEAGLFAMIDLKHDLPNEWLKGKQTALTEPEFILSKDKIKEFLPFYASIKNKIEMIMVVVETRDNSSVLKLNDETFKKTGTTNDPAQIFSAEIKNIAPAIFPLSITNDKKGTNAIIKAWAIVKFTVPVV